MVLRGALSAKFINKIRDFEMEIKNLISPYSFQQIISKQDQIAKFYSQYLSNYLERAYSTEGEDVYISENWAEAQKHHLIYDSLKISCYVKASSSGHSTFLNNSLSQVRNWYCDSVYSKISSFDDELFEHIQNLEIAGRNEPPIAVQDL